VLEPIEKGFGKSNNSSETAVRPNMNRKRIIERKGRLIMKTLIIYASTYGFTKDCVAKLKELLKGEVFAANIMTDSIPPLEDFENIIIGGSIYMGQIQKKLKLYCIENCSSLVNKRLALFLSCGLPESFELTLKNAFPEAVIAKAVTKKCFGGELRISKMNFAHKMIAGLMKKTLVKEGKSEISQITENIVSLAECMNTI